ncbi:MAG: hypothetical protein JNK64_07605 [Myxococcales bacterium]|nr:hypothetical protein [Myxococcales bacterium]
MVDGVDGGAGEAPTSDGAAAATASDWRALDQTLRQLARRRAALDVEEARYLRQARAEGLHRRFGYGSFFEYAERVLGYAPAVTRERMRVADALATLPKLHAAMAAGDLAYSAVRELTRVATTENEAEWLDAAATRTVREIEDMVSGRRLGDAPDDARDPALLLHERRFLLSAATLGAYVKVRDVESKACGRALTDDEVMALLCAERLAGTTAPDPAARRPQYQIALSQCPDCAKGWIDVAGQAIELSATEIAQASCDAELLGRVDGEAPPRVTKTIPPRVRRAALRRDRGRCRVPGCRNARFVDLHHVVPRAKGGDHRPTWLATMCSAHHKAAHDGRLLVTKDSRGRLRFAHADGRPYGAQPSHVGDPPPAPPGQQATVEKSAAAPAPAPAADASAESPSSTAVPQGPAAKPGDVLAAVAARSSSPDAPVITALPAKAHLERSKVEAASHVGRATPRPATPRTAKPRSAEAPAMSHVGRAMRKVPATAHATPAKARTAQAKARTVAAPGPTAPRVNTRRPKRGRQSRRGTAPADASEQLARRHRASRRSKPRSRRGRSRR